MRPRHVVGLTAAGLTAVLGLPIPAASATASVLYVSTGTTCSDSGSGTQAQPFCTVSAAANIVQPGQTVQLNGTFTESVHLTRSGTPDQPIVFTGNANILAPSGQSGPAIEIAGVHDVTVQNFSIAGGLVVKDSSGVTLNRLDSGNSGRNNLPQVRITGASSRVAVTRNDFWASGSGGIAIDAGVTGTTVSNNVIADTNGSPIAAVDAPGTTVTNNTLDSGCGPAISLTGASTGSNVFNNIAVNHNDKPVAGTLPCQSGASATEILIAAGSTTGTRVDYNLVRPYSGTTSPTASYSWSGTSYATPAEFTAATGQGAHDIQAVASYGPFHGNGAYTPEVDSADATAPGVLATDFNGNPPADDPLVPNTGTGFGYLDRGAIERQDNLASVSVAVDRTQAPYPIAVTATATPIDDWPSALTYEFDFGDGTIVTATKPTATHTYTAACACAVSVTAVNGVGKRVTSLYAAHVKVTEPGDLKPQFTATPQLPTTRDPLSRIRPLSITVDASATTSPWPVTGYTVNYGDGTGTGTSFGHTYSSPGDYTVTVTATDAGGRTASTSQVFHAAYAPSGYVPITPYRLLDTRNGGGTLLGGVAQAVHIPVGLEAHPLTSGSIASVVLNVTATESNQDTYLTVWPSGQKRPATSNVNVKAGHNAATLVTVPIGSDGAVDIVNNSGTAQVVVDMFGYYQPNTGDKFSPVTPSRLADTRYGSGGKLGADATRNLKVAGAANVPANATAVVLNLTATQATASSYLTVSPGGLPRPGVSNLNFVPGQDVANQVIVPLGKDGSIDVHNFAGDVHFVADVFGYYSPDGKGLFTPVYPTRLLDTRGAAGPFGPTTTRQLAIGGTAGVPAGATAAVLNLTATDTTARSFLAVSPTGTGSGHPAISNLNFGPADTIPNHVIAPLGTNGQVDLYNNNGNVDVITDLLGYFTTS